MPSKRGNGEGSIYKTKDGRFRGSAMVGGRRRYVSGKTRREAADRLKELVGREAIGIPAPSGRLTVAAWMEEWLATDVTKSVRQGTLADYRSITHLYVVPSIGRVLLRDLTPAHVLRLHADMAARGLSRGTILKAHRVLGRALKVAQRWDHVHRNVASLVTPPSGLSVELREIPSRDVQTLLRAIHDDEWRARWHLAFLGLRQGEVLGLSWASVDLDRAVVSVTQALRRVTGKGLVLAPPKSSASRRSLPIPQEVVAALGARRASQMRQRLVAGDRWANHADLVFTGPLGQAIDPKRDYDSWCALLKRNNLPHYRLHDARRTAGTILAASGASLRATQDWLGHSSIAQANHYVGAVPALLVDASGLIEREFFAG